MLQRNCWRYTEHINKEVLLANQPPTQRGESWSEERLKEMWDFPIDYYLERMEGADRAIILGIKARQSAGIDVPNDYLAGMTKRYPDKFGFCCSVYPRAEGAAQEVSKLHRRLRES